MAVGSIQARKRVRRDGSSYRVWRAQVPHPNAPPSSGRKLEKTFGSKRGAENWIKSYHRALDGGTYIDARNLNTPLRQVADDWQATWPHKLRAEDAGELSRDLLAKHLLPRWGDDAVGSITSAEIQKWIDKLAKRLATSTVHHCYTVLRDIVKLAKARNLIPANPCSSDAITLPSKTRGPRAPRKALFLSTRS